MEVIVIHCKALQVVVTTYCGQSGQTTIIDNQTELDNILGCTDFYGDL